MSAACALSPSPSPSVTVAPSARGAAGSGLRAVPPESPPSVRVGMPQLDAGGLSEGWLLRDAGDRHWEAIGRRLGVATDEIRGEAGERLYPTVVAVRARYQAPLAVVRENDLLELAAEVVPCGRACAHGRVTAVVGATGARFALELLTTFAARAEGGRGGLRRAPPEPTLARDWLPVGPAPAIATLARAARRGEPLCDAFSGPVLALPDRPLAELTYEPSPYADYNGAGLLYFASYVTIADSVERQMVRQLRLDRQSRDSSCPADWALATSAVRRDVFYYDNLPLGASLTATLRSFASDGHEVTTHVRFCRAGDPAAAGTPRAAAGPRPMADIVTRRRFVDRSVDRRVGDRR